MKLSTTIARPRLPRTIPWRTIGAWGVVLVLSVAAIVTLLGSSITTDDRVSAPTDSRRAYELLSRTPPEPGLRGRAVVVRSERYTVDDPEFQRFLDGLGRGARRGPPPRPQVLDRPARDPDPDPARARRRGADRRGRSRPSQRRTTTRLRRRDHRRVHARPRLQRALAAGPPERRALLRPAGRADRARARLRRRSSPGSSRCCSRSSRSSSRSRSPPSIGQTFELSFFIVNMISGMGLALGIDYALFVVSRYREERRRGRDKLGAIETSGADVEPRRPLQRARVRRRDARDAARAAR